MRSSMNAGGARYRRALAIASVFTLVAAVVHGAWHGFFGDYAALANLSAVQLQTVELLNAAIALFLLFLAATCLWASRSSSLSPRDLGIFTALVLGFWLARLALEWVMPLRIPLLWIEQPGVVVKLVIAFPVIVLGWPLMPRSD